MTHNEDAKKYITHYLDPGQASDFAILLDGPWGSGKTHFIKKLLKERDDAAKGADPLAGSGHLYASLYGVKSPGEITEQFFAQAHPLLNSRAARILGSSISGVAQLFTGAKLNESGNNGDVVKDMVLKLEGRILVFDDLERCSMPISEAMGFINSYVEHEGLKVIVIANQAEIPADQRSEYDRRKEKLVGKTLRVGSDPSDVFDLFVRDIANKPAQAAATASKEAVLRTFAASGKSNFRSLRAVFADFDRLVSLIDDKVQASSDALHRLLLFVVATGLEFRAGNLGVEELSNLSTSLSMHRFNKTSEEEMDASKPAYLLAIYQDVEWSNPIVPPDRLAHLYETGIVDVEPINKYVLEHPVVVGYKSAPAWRQLWSWTDLPREHYEAARTQLVAELNNHELIHPGIILHVAGEIVSLASWGDHILGKGTDVVAYFEEYLKNLLASSRMVPARGVFDSFGGSFAGLGYPSEQTDEFKQISKSVREATFEAFSGLMKSEAPALLKRLQDASGEAHSALYEYGIDEGNYADCPVLHHIRADDFADIMVVDSRPIGRLFASLAKRYEHDEHSGLLIEEHEWITKLREELTKRAVRAPVPHNELIETRIKSYFEKIEKSCAIAKAREADES